MAQEAVNLTENGANQSVELAQHYYHSFMREQERAMAATEEARAMAGNVAVANIQIRQREREIEALQGRYNDLREAFQTQNDANQQQYERVTYLEGLVCGIAAEIEDMTEDIREDYFAVLYQDGSPEPRSYLSHIAQVVQQTKEEGADCGCTGSE